MSSGSGDGQDYVQDHRQDWWHGMLGGVFRRGLAMPAVSWLGVSFGHPDQGMVRIMVRSWSGSSPGRGLAIAVVAGDGQAGSWSGP